MSVRLSRVQTRQEVSGVRLIVVVGGNGHVTQRVMRCVVVLRRVHPRPTSRGCSSGVPMSSPREKKLFSEAVRLSRDGELVERVEGHKAIVRGGEGGLARRSASGLGTVVVHVSLNNRQFVHYVVTRMKKSNKRRWRRCRQASRQGQPLHQYYPCPSSP